ncbi:MAG TPA: hypothetical protein VMQ52_05300 [Candidatus Saccharimonadales bacterium]|jgi:hypothetical protein|nr:MAG: replication associated protein [Cressdnaviricota sp.]HUD08469.1 hypothetical protein [Candidatus Saccharimonadales bacterium]
MTARSYAFTAFKDPKLDDLPKGVSYVVYQHEICPTTGKDHWQGFIQFRQPQRWTKVQSLIADETLHVEKAKGSPEDNRRYCTKLKSKAENEEYVEFGIISKGQGERTDLAPIRKAILIDKKTVSELLNEEKLLTGFVQLKYAENIIRYQEPNWDRVPFVAWITGKTGAGKSRFALSTLGKIDTYLLSDNPKFWDGYNGQQNVIIDDLKPGFFTIMQILRLLDRYPVRVESKGSSMWLRATNIIITSIYYPQQIWNNTDEDNKQLLRRITILHDLSSGPVPEVLWKSGKEIVKWNK